MNRRLMLTSIAAIIFTAAAGCGGNFVHIHGADEGSDIGAEERSQRGAVLVLSGVRVTSKGRRAIREWLSSLSYDAYFPDFDTDGGLAGCVDQLDAFIERHRLREYGQLYAFTYIMGGWTLNLYLRENEIANLTRVVYDRSPIQEQGPRVSLESLPRTINFLYGPVVADIRDTPYPPNRMEGVEIGMIIESRAMGFLIRRKDRVLANGPLEWEPESFNQDHDDFTYVYLTHDEMYYSFDQIGPELEHFYEHGRFTDDARREPFDKDPFQ
jgi:hypothetical protein